MCKNLQNIISIAQGKKKADIVFKNANIFNSFTGDFECADLALAGGYIAGIGEYEGNLEHNATGKYITPAFADAHVHIESSMLAPQELVKILLLNGTTSIFADPHEIVNVLGTKGMDYMLQATEGLPVDVYFTLPSCVPASPFETAGVVFDLPEFALYSEHKRVLGLGEMMNFPGVINMDTAVLQRLQYKKDCPLIDGHAPGVSGKQLNAYMAAGITSDHEAFTAIEAEEKLRRGLYLYIREGSAAKNSSALIGAINEYNYRRACFATDDRHVTELLEQGGINYAVKLALQNGAKLGHVINMASLNTFERFGIKNQGALIAGYKADLLVFDNLFDWRARTVLKSGMVVVDDFQLCMPTSKSTVLTPESSLKLPQHIDLFIADTFGHGLANVIKTSAGQIVTEKWQTHVPVENGGFVADTERYIQKIAVLESHLGSGNIGLGLASIEGMSRGAIASTVAHDAHNLVVLGTNDVDMLLAISEIERMGGGQVVVDGGRVLAALPLTIAGLMSTDSYEAVAKKLKELDEAAYLLGIEREINPFMLLSFVCLSVIPALKITDKGLVDSEKFDFVDVSAK